MKLYNKVAGTETIKDHNGTHIHSQNYSNAIITTVEELRSLWFSAQNFGRDISNYESDKSPSHNGYVNFETYLQSKGISI